MKKCILLSLLSASLLLASCGGNQTPEKVVKEASQEQIDATEIINYTNLLIDYLNTTSVWMENNAEVNAGMVAFVRTKKKPAEFVSPSKRAGLDSEKGRLPIMPTSLSAENRAYLDKKLGLFQKQTSIMYRNSHAIYDYIKNDDYRKDAYRKGLTMSDSIESGYRSVSDSRKDVYVRIALITDDAEEVLLSDSPIREPIKDMKGDLKRFKEMYANFGLYDRDKVSAQHLDKLYNTLKASVEENKGEHTDLLNEYGMKASYDSYYEQCMKSLSVCEKVLRKVNARGKMSSEDKTQMSGDYDALVSLYNRSGF